MPQQKKPLFSVLAHPQTRGRSAMPPVSARWAPTPLGSLLMADDGIGICFIGLEIDGSRGRADAQIRAKFAAIKFVKTPTPLMIRAEKLLRAQYTGGVVPASPLPISLYGTAFQIRVWRTLASIPFGALVTYGDVARKIGMPRAARAVGGAVGANPVSIFIPCHRVIGAHGNDGLYGWGREVKMNLIQKEAS